MPPQENQGNLPTPASSGQPSAQPASNQTPVSVSPASGENSSKTPGNKRLKIVSIVVAGALIILAALLLLPFSPFSLKKGAQLGPKMTVGDKPFIYACSVLDNDTVGKELGLNQDKSKQNVEESFSFDPSNKKDRSVDLVKLTGEKSASSSCEIKFDRVLKDQEGQQVASFINVTAFIEQYPSEQDATTKFNSAKSALGDRAKTLSSYDDSSYYTAPTRPISGPTYVQPVVKHKNLLIYYTAPLKADDQEANKMVGQLNNLTKDVLRRIDAKEGEKPKSFSGINSIGKNTFIDACHGVNYAAFAKELGGDTEYEPTSFTATQGYAPSDNNGQSPKNLTSLCSFDFRTKADADALGTSRPTIPTGKESAGELGSEETGYKSFYPHFALVQIVTTEKKEDAQKMVANFKKSGEGQQSSGIKIEDIKIGDTGLKISSSPSEANPYDSKLYYVAKDTHAYLLSVAFKRQEKPFKTTGQSFSDDQARKIIRVLEAAK